MANYRRLISYIYAYEGEVKGRNIGFVKLESRNGQCKLSVNVKKVYVGSSDLGVYLLCQQKEIFLGSIFIRGGCGEFRGAVKVDNVADSGSTMDDCYGLTIHEKGDSWRAYTTIWEDAVAHAAELELADVTSGQIEGTEAQLQRKVEELEQELSEDSPQKTGTCPEMPELEPEEAAEENAQPIAEAGGDLEPEAGVQTEDEPDNGKPTEIPDENLTAPSSSGSPEEEMPLLPGNPLELERLDQEEKQSVNPIRLWDQFRKQHPKIQAFDSSNGCEILTIKPQDIGLLPRENWIYGNNSFLLHGYYNYRYLIFARIGDEECGRVRYILGVPGNYYSNEKYMASMFGFPHFVLSKKQPLQDGRFGYWYTDVKMENQD